MSGFMSLITAALPFIGSALGGPLGAGAMTFVASRLGVPEDTVQSTLAAMVGNPDSLAKAKDLDMAYKTHLADLGYSSATQVVALNAQVVEEVNKTMQSEAASDHWPTYSWRPFIGFMFGAYIASFLLLPLFHITPVQLDSNLVLAIGGILGIASYFRGKMQADPAMPNSDNRG